MCHSQGGKSETSVLPILPRTPLYSLRTPLVLPSYSLVLPPYFLVLPSYFLVLPWYSLRTPLVLPRTPSCFLVLPRTSWYSLVLPRTPFVLPSYFGSTEVSLFPPWSIYMATQPFCCSNHSACRYRRYFLSLIM